MPQAQGGSALCGLVGHSECDPLLSLCLSLVPCLISFIQKVKNNLWVTLTRTLQPSSSTFVKLDQMDRKGPSRTLIWWLDVLFPQTVSSLGQGLLRETIRCNGKSAFGVGCVCV